MTANNFEDTNGLSSPTPTVEQPTNLSGFVERVDDAGVGN
jgi:hypothetical protein